MGTGFGMWVPHTSALASGEHRCCSPQGAPEHPLLLPSLFTACCPQPWAKPCLELVVPRDCGGPGGWGGEELWGWRGCSSTSVSPAI